MSLHFIVGYNLHTFYDLIDDIMDKSENHHLIFNDHNALDKIIKLCGVTEEISKMTIGIKYKFINNIPIPYYNYFKEQHLEMCHILLDHRQYDEIMLTSELIKEIYSFDEFDEIDEIKDYYFNNKCTFKMDKIKKYNWTIFEQFINEFNQLDQTKDGTDLNKLKDIYTTNIKTNLLDKYYRIYTDQVEK